MPIEISRKVLQKKDSVAKTSSTFLYDAPYVIVSQQGYGRMDASTPAEGLSTDGVASCLAVVLHSATTGRTVLTHSPNFLFINTFMPIVDWVTGGNGEVDPDVRSESMEWYAGAGATPCVLETVVLRGFLYATPQAVNFGHDEWMDDFRAFFAKFASRRNIQLNIVDLKRFLLKGAVLVDKTTARITILDLAKGVRPRDVIIFLTNSELSQAESYSDAQRAQDRFVAQLLSCHIPKQSPPLSLQYNVSRYCVPLPLTDEGRQLVRSKREGESKWQQSAIVKAFGPSDDWIFNPGSLANLTLQALVRSLPCELCGEFGIRKCSACKGAWYCGEAHQREDWKSHKGWCKSHPFSKSSLDGPL